MIKTPKHIWIDPDSLTAKETTKVRILCEKGIGTRCLNTIFQKTVAKKLNRRVRKMNTLNGFANWSEFINGVWHMFQTPLTLEYAKKIDNYDATGKQFKLPKRPPFGEIFYKGICPERKDAPEVISERKKRYNERVAAGLIVPRSKFRHPQAAAIAQRETIISSISRKQLST